MSEQPSEFCPACGAPEGGRHDKVLHQIADYEASLRPPASDEKGSNDA